MSKRPTHRPNRSDPPVRPQHPRPEAQRPRGEPPRPRGGSGNRPGAPAGRGGQGASVSANFEVADVRRFLDRLGMPKNLVAGLDEWIRGMDVEDEPEQTEAPLEWDGRPATLTIAAAVDDQGLAHVEFQGPDSLIEEIQTEMDDFFRDAEP